MDIFKQLVAFVLIAFVAFFFGQMRGRNTGFKDGWDAGQKAAARYYQEYYRTNAPPMTIIPVLLTNTPASDAPSARR